MGLGGDKWAFAMDGEGCEGGSENDVLQDQ